MDGATFAHGIVARPRMQPTDDHPPRRLDAVQSCFELLKDGRDEEARSSFDPGVIRLATELLRADQSLEDRGTPAPVEQLVMAGLPAGTIIGCFQLLEAVGEGASGQVFRARQLTPARDVALKVLWPCSRAEAFDQRREAALLSQLEHPGIARLYEVGVWEHAGTFRPWIAMELVNDARPLSPESTATWSLKARVNLIASVADALAHAHSKGIIHRDVKAANVLLRTDGSARVIDFGLARSDGPGRDRSIALLGDRIVGSLASLAPECLWPGATADARSDVFGLGTIAFGLLAGRPMRVLDGQGITQAIRQIADESLPRLASVDRRLRGDLDRIIARATAADPAQRYSSMAAFAQDLREHLAGRPVLITQQALIERLVRAVRRHWRTSAAVAVAAVALVSATSISMRAAWHAREQARRANLSAAASAVDASDQLALDRALSTMTNDGSTEANLLRRVAAMRGVTVADGDWYALAAGPDGSWIVGSAAQPRVGTERGHLLSRWDGTDPTWSIQLPLATTGGVAISPDGAWIACCHVSEGVSVVEAESGRVHRAWPAHPGENGGVPCFLADGSLAVLTTMLRRTDVHGAPIGASIGLGVGEARSVHAMDDGSLLVAGHLGAMVVDPMGRKPTVHLDCPPARQSATWCTPQGDTVLVGGFDRTIRCYGPHGGEPLWTGRTHHDNVWSITGLDPRRVVSAGADGVLAVWDLKTGTSISLPASPDVVWSLLLWRGGLWIGSQGGLRLQTDEAIDRWIGTHTDRRRQITAPQWSAWIEPDGSLAGRHRDGRALPLGPGLGAFALLASDPCGDRLCGLTSEGTIVCIEAMSGSVLWTERTLASDDSAEIGGIPMLAMQDDLGLLLVASRRHGCVAVDLHDGSIAWMSAIGQQCAAVGAGPGGTLLAGGRDGLLARLAGDGRVIDSTRSQRGRAASLTCDDAGSRILLGGVDGTLRVLDTATLDERLAIRLSNAALDCLWTDEDGIWTIDRDGIVRCR